MFRLYRSSDARQLYGRGPTASAPVDSSDASRIAKGVAALPEPHRLAVQWYYVRPVAPARACQMIGTTQPGLAQLVSDGRVMLRNRRA